MIPRLRWQCRRGMLELDVILAKFLDSYYATLSPQLQQDFAVLLTQDDPILFDWLVASIPCDRQDLEGIVKKIISLEPHTLK